MFLPQAETIHRTCVLTCLYTHSMGSWARFSIRQDEGKKTQQACRFGGKPPYSPTKSCGESGHTLSVSYRDEALKKKVCRLHGSLPGTAQPLRDGSHLSSALGVNAGGEPRDTEM